MNKNDIFSEYIRTFLITLVTAFIFVVVLLVISQFQAYNFVKRQDSPEKNISPYMVKLLIDKNIYLAQQNPRDYKLNIKIGLLYEYTQDFQDAEYQYKLAISKSDLNDYSAYRDLALLYIRLNRLDDAANIIDEIDERPFNPLIAMKGYVYAIIADAYYQKGDYEDAIDFYQKSLMYYKIIHSSEEKTVVDSMASSYIYSAERYVSNLRQSDAIEALQEADKLENAPIIKYKLALLLMASNPQQAYKYFQKVFDTEPSIINYDIYYNFILRMAADADMKGNTSLGDLYRFRAQKYKDYFQKHIITVDDINLQYVEGKVTYNMFSRKYKINLQMKLSNISDRPISSLYTIVKFENEDGTPITNYVTQVVDDKSILAPSSMTPVINIREYKKKSLSDKHPKAIIAEVYFAVSANSYKVHLATIRITEYKVLKQGHKNVRNKKFSLTEFIKDEFDKAMKVMHLKKH